MPPSPPTSRLPSIASSPGLQPHIEQGVSLLPHTRLPSWQELHQWHLPFAAPPTITGAPKLVEHHNLPPPEHLQLPNAHCPHSTLASACYLIGWRLFVLHSQRPTTKGALAKRPGQRAWGGGQEDHWPGRMGG